MFVVTLSVMRR